MIELFAYRHKEHKEIWLRRNNVCGCGRNTQCYDACDLREAIYSVMFHKGEFENRMTSYDGGSTLVEFDIFKDMEFDGYKGRLKKRVRCTTADFEKVVFREVVEE